MISKRQDYLLNFIVSEYIKTAHPVPSILASRKSGFRVSPATIRNDMNNLEEEGYLTQPHTSGGRVPTDKAYRHYANKLLDEAHFKISTGDKREISVAIQRAGIRPRVLSRAITDVLSELSGNLVIAGVAQDAEFFKQGLAALFKSPEFKESEDFFQVANFFENFDRMFQLVEREFLQILGTPTQIPIQVLIGHENPFRQISNETIICAKYLLPGDHIGSLTLVGPTRMDYERNIGLINHTVQVLQKINQT